MLVRRLSMVLLAVALLIIPLQQALSANSSPQSEPKKDVILKASGITPMLFPERVFYRGQVAAVQMRNTGGIHFAGQFYVLAGLVDTSGYASDVREKYQGYLLAEVPVEISGNSLKPGAYGIDFVAASKFIVSDLGGNTIIEAAGQRDAELKRPMPLQILAAPDSGAHRLYIGRNFVTIKRAS